jgi:tetratricopeptide (TPR) repeat protein
VQLTTQLIDGASDAHIWVNAYQANMSNPETVFEIQADIAMQVANALHVEFFGSERAEIERVPTQSREAYELYLAAQPGNSCAFADPCNPRAVELLDQALLLDDQFAEAWAKKAYAHSNMHVVRPDEADLTAAIYAAERAIDLAPDRGDGYAMRAVLLGIRSDWIGADAAYEQARRFGISPAPDPRFLTAVGDIETALEVIESQLDTDPLNAELFVFRFFGQEILGNQEAANETFERGQRLFRNNWGGAGLFNFIDLGRGDAGPVYERAVGNVLYSELIALLDDPDQALALINDLSSNRTPANLGTLAVYAAFLGDQQLAVRLFRDAVSDYGVLMFMAWLPVFDEVRQLPEFKELLRDIGLVDYWRATDWPSVCRPIGADFECA